MNTVRSALVIFLGVILVGCGYSGTSVSVPTVDSKSVLTIAAATAFFKLTDDAVNLGDLRKILLFSNEGTQVP